MKSQSDTEPNVFVQSRGKTQANYHIAQVEKPDQDGTMKLVWEYDYIEVIKTDRESLIRALMKTQYDIEDEIALVNNKINGDAEGISDYNTYQQYRSDVDVIVNGMI